MTNDQIQIVTETATKLSRSYTYPGFELKDVIQFSLQSAEDIVQKGKYDESRPFVNFIYTHLRNRLFNNKRNNWYKYVKYKAAEVAQLNHEPMMNDYQDETLERIDSEELLDKCPVQLRSTLLRTIYKCKISSTKKTELKTWLKNQGL